MRYEGVALRKSTASGMPKILMSSILPKTGNVQKQTGFLIDLKRLVLFR